MDGFRWGPVDVERWYTDEKVGRVLLVTTEHLRLEVAVSPKGRNVRVWLNGKQLRQAGEED